MKITPRPDQPLPPLARKHEPPTSASDPSRTPPPSVTAEISEEARQKVVTATGKNAASPAQRARETLDAYDNLGHLHFGRIVSALARGEEPPGETPEPPAGDIPPTTTPEADMTPTDTATTGATDDGTTTAGATSPDTTADTGTDGGSAEPAPETNPDGAV